MARHVKCLDSVIAVSFPKSVLPAVTIAILLVESGTLSRVNLYFGVRCLRTTNASKAIPKTTRVVKRAGYDYLGVA